MPHHRTPPSPFPGKGKSSVSVEGRSVVLTEESVFGRTSVRMDSATAKHIARLLFLAAAEVEKSAAVVEEEEDSPLPKLVAVG